MRVTNKQSGLMVLRRGQGRRSVGRLGRLGRVVVADGRAHASLTRHPLRIVRGMSSTPDQPDSTPNDPTLDPAAVIAGAATEPATGAGDPTDAVEPARTPEGKEVAPLRAKYPRAGNGWILAGVAFFLVALMFAFADVTVSERNDTLTNVQECGTVVSPQDPSDPDWVSACEDARGERLWMIAVPAALGVLSIGYGLVLRRRPVVELG